MSPRAFVGCASAALALWLAAGVAAAASPCAGSRPGVGVPIQVRAAADNAADFGTPQEACARTSVSLDNRLAVLDASDVFYGSVYFASNLRGTVDLPWGFWISFAVPGLEYRYVANATVDQKTVSMGAGALGVHVPVMSDARTQLTLAVRALVPSETIFVRAKRYGFEQGLSLLRQLGPHLELDGNLGAVALATVGPGRETLRFSPFVSTDLVYRPWRALGLAAGANLRPLDALDLRMQVRVYPYRRLAIALGAAAPVVGRDRTDLALAFSLGWDGF